ncbi:uncharacterized protein V6R79_008940 [Siganus canaliculatus]
MQTPDTSAEVDSTTNPGLSNTESISITITITTQTDGTLQDDNSQDYKYPSQETSQAPPNSLEFPSKQSITKNMKSELEISPDNEVLDSHSKESPQTPATCQGENKVSLTNLGKPCHIPNSTSSASSEQSLQATSNICSEHWQLKKIPEASDQRADGVDPEEGAEPLVKYYHTGQTFTVMFADGTGQVYYPSGRLAVLVCAAQSADWSCVLILEDKHLQPQIQAVFTSEGRATCYHNNGCVWVNLTPWGGTYCSATGELKKHWSWQDKKCHARAPPYKPLCMTLNPNLHIRIQSLDHICITFNSGECSAQIGVGVKFKPNKGKGVTPPGPDMLQKHLQQKSAEINVLLQNIQSLISYQNTVSLQKVKPQQSLISQMERRRLPTKRQQSAKKTP